MRRYWCIALILLPLPGGCRNETREPPVAPKPPEVTISQVVRRSVTDFEDFTGRMDAVESVEVRARVRGYLNEIHFTEGQEVKAGMPLFEIDPRTFEAELKNAEGQKAQWTAKREKSKADVARYEGLVPSGAASAQDLDKARAELGEAVAAIQSADAAIDRAKLDLEFSKITAPVDGQIGRAMITKGNLIQAGSGQDAVLTTIVSLDPMYGYFAVNERAMLEFRDRYRGALPKDQAGASPRELKVPVTLGLANDVGYPHSGIIDFADNRVDSDTGTILVRATFDNAKRTFKPGLFARVRIPISMPYDAVLVSQLAVATDQGQRYVLVVKSDNVVERRFVRTGALQDDGLQVITQGLQADDWVVVNGVQRARPGQPVTPQRVEMPTTRIRGEPGGPATKPAADSKTS